MTDQICLDTCQVSFEKNVNRLNEVLLNAIVQADGDEELERRAREKFERGLGFAQKARDICISSCNS